MKQLSDISNILDCFVPKLTALDYISDIYLFGSYARGTATIRSDVDIAIINTWNSPSPAMKHAVTKALYDSYDGDLDFQFSYVNKDDFEAEDNPRRVATSIKNEGILLWSR